MRQLLFVVLFLILLNITIVISAPPKCLTTENVYYDYKHYSIEYKQEVDWWYLHTASHAYGAFYTDSALSSKKKIIQLPLYDGRVGEQYPNPFYKTYQQALEKDPNLTNKSLFKSLIYNEQIGTVNEGAHSKGFFIWNDDGGIHVIHSNPNTPWDGFNGNNGNFMKQSSKPSLQHAQHHFCRTISKEDLLIIPKYIILGDVRVVGINGKDIGIKRFSSNIGSIIKGSDDNLIFDNDELKQFLNLKKLTFKNVIDFIEANLIKFSSTNDLLFSINKWVQIANQVATKYITSSTTNEWQYFSGIYDKNEELYFIQSTIGSLIKKNRKEMFPGNPDNGFSIERTNKDKLLTFDGFKTGYNILYEYISQQTGMNSFNWISQTETKIFKNQNGKNVMPYDRYGIKVVAQYSFEFNHPKDGHSNLKVNTGHDHTKLFYGYKDENPDQSIMCIGDLNWQGKQEVRGGGLFCSKKMAYLANYLRRHAYFFRATSSPEKKYVNENVIPNSGSMVKFDFSEVKNELGIVTNNNQLPTIGDINFEIRTLFEPTGSSVPKYIPLPGSRIIVMNKPLLKPQFNKDEKITFIQNTDGYKYNCGYESVNIPLLVNQNTINIISKGFEFDLENYSFNVFTSNNVKLYICPDNKNQDCDYEDSEYVQLFTHTPRVSTKLRDINNNVKEYNWEVFKVIGTHYSVQFTTAVKDELIKRLKFVQNIALIKSIAPTYSKTIKISKGTTPSNSLYYFKDAESLCNIKASSDDEAIIIPYYDYCYDVLFYCFKRINEFKQTGDTINTADGFEKVYKEFKKVKVLTNTQECFKYDDPPSGSNPKLTNDKKKEPIGVPHSYNSGKFERRKRTPAQK